MTRRYLRLKDLLERVPLSRPTIYRLVKKRDFPQPVKLGAASVWIESEIEQWVSNKMAQRANV
ncbi:MAG: transcriptional regulator [Stutzerimonas stutzeri]|nr:MAG: transcriptional regulator [Stutzerimonas stutzeri]